uniref:Uncharacterized protein n=1 Tax=Anopheles atroparvus TaxID=41427 RepID=A0AAG5DCJ6_ANOAO
MNNCYCCDQFCYGGVDGGLCATPCWCAPSGRCPGGPCSYTCPTFPPCGYPSACMKMMDCTRAAQVFHRARMSRRMILKNALMYD